MSFVHCPWRCIGPGVKNLVPHLPSFATPNTIVGLSPSGSGHVFDTGSVGRRLIMDVPLTSYIGDTDISVNFTLQGQIAFSRGRFPLVRRLHPWSDVYVLCS